MRGVRDGQEGVSGNGGGGVAGRHRDDEGGGGGGLKRKIRGRARGGGAPWVGVGAGKCVAAEAVAYNLRSRCSGVREEKAGGGGGGGGGRDVGECALKLHATQSSARWCRFR